MRADRRVDGTYGFTIPSTYIGISGSEYVMSPVLFQTLPEIFGFAVAVSFLEICALLLFSGRRFLKQASIAAAGLVGAVAGEGIAISLFPAGAWIAIAAGLVGGAVLGRYLRPVGVGLTLAYLAFSVVGNLGDYLPIQYAAALVIFAYGLLLTDLAPTFVASLLASSILVLFGEWSGISPPGLIILASAVGAARVMASVLPSRLALRGQRSDITGR